MKKLKHPTRLQILQHRITKKKYFSKSIKDDDSLEKYYGSGTYWLDHLKVHGEEVDRLWVSDWYYDESITRFALRFSILNKIVESDEWANLILENGIDGGTREMAYYASMAAVKVNKGKKRPDHSTFMKELMAEKRKYKPRAHTPYGVFYGVSDAVRNTPAKDYNTVKSYLDGKVLTKQMIGSHLRFCKDNPLFTYEDIGKNTNNLGWYWMDKK